MYWHIGDAAMRLRSVTALSVYGSKRWGMAGLLVGPHQCR
jgi:hypothetical protein